jgi:hypothetical protein
MAKAPSKPVILELLGWAERSGLNLGGLFLLSIGIYGGQYAKLFPEHMQDYAAGFCLVVSATGFLTVLYQLIKGFRSAREDLTQSKPISPSSAEQIQ